MSKFWSEAIRQLTPYVPGEQPKVSNLIKLNTNENPYPPSPKVAQAIHSFDSERLRLYPDPDASLLKQTLADYLSVKPAQVFVGNGSDEVLAHTFMAFFRQPEPLLMPDISYSFYDVYCNLYGIECRHIPLREDFGIALSDYNLANGGIIFANPNAPTGKVLPLDDIEALLKQNTESVVVVDEAYIDFGGQSASTLVDQYANLLVIQTFSKSRSLAGMRIGFAIGNETLIEGLERVKNSFNSYPLDMLAQVTAIEAIKDDTYFKETTQKVIDTRDWTTSQLASMGFKVVPSGTNFVFASHRYIPAAELMGFLRTHNILVRHFSRPIIDNHLRISIGTDEEMQALIDCLKSHPEVTTL
ncbi:histidinol-phosphate transaminase [Neptunomonas concharum]|uniref:Histidinol-phosphate aminotransferase n=1 Tax=Neptunomonas concharum TaxID=1031538 RepID=A0A5P1RB39_9GAMM|nr:histidinol-phosphate transaminase [Neptunomonas concharum]QEQ96485.1 histidinol-phosphate transaminase [Neptunomonas concharum]